MPPTVAVLLWLTLLLVLLYFDPARDEETSWTLWVPLTWMFILGSRLPSQWLGFGIVGSRAQALQEGNPLDRAILAALIVLAVGILLRRSFQWGEFFMRNLALVSFLTVALLSLLWSDFPLVTFRKWSRDIGGYVVILTVLSDPRPLEAVRTLLRRLGYLLIPLSILLIKYYIHLGRTHDPWSGRIEFTGASTSKNMLGLLCLVSGVFFFWDTLTRWAGRYEPRARRIILVNLAFIGMTLWLLKLAHSATSTVCLALGCMVIAAAHTGTGKNHPGLLKVLAPAGFFLYLILAVGFGMSGSLAVVIGKSANLSDRTNMWASLLSMQTHPLMGFGYQSFFLGSRISGFWGSMAGDNVLEAHNGYLSVYLELGTIGLCLLCLFLIASYRKICERLQTYTPFGSLGLGLWTILLFYNVTEAAFEIGLLWIVFVMGTVAVPEEEQVTNVATLDERPLEEAVVPRLEVARRLW
jgi:O-antigen ligase